MRNGVDSFEFISGASANLQLLESGKALPFGKGLGVFATTEAAAWLESG